jgi:FkbM family methyltransferase
MLKRERGFVYLIGRALELYRIARGLREYISVTHFILVQMVRRTVRRPMETSLRLRGVNYRVAVPSRETFPFAEIYLDRVYERFEEFVARPGWTVVDAGANVGAFAVRQAQIGARVIAFEPNPSCARRLWTTVSRSGLEQVTLIPCALGAELGTATLVVGGSTLAGSLVETPEDGAVERFLVKVETLDHVAEALGLVRVDLLKVDVEFAEVEVLRGAVRTLPRVERVVVEYHSRDLLTQVCELLAGHGFRCRGRYDFSDSPYGVAYFLRPALDGA